MDMNMSMNMEDIEKKTMTIVSEDGTEEVVEVILAFEFKDNKKEYIVYTKNEEDDNGVEDENEWNRIKDVLRELSKD